MYWTDKSKKNDVRLCLILVRRMIEQQEERERERRDQERLERERKQLQDDFKRDLENKRKK